MSDVVVLPLRERAFRWLMLAGSVALHGVAMVVFRLHGEVEVPRFRERSRLQAIVPSLERSDRLHPTLMPGDLFDSSLMALPSGPGFSGRMWQRGIPPVRRVAETDWKPVLLEAPEAPPWMELAPAVPLAQAVRARPVPPEEWLEEPGEWVASTRLAPTASVYRVSGLLAGRAVRWAPTVPVLAAPAMVRATVLRVAVDREGSVRHIVRERSSGDEQVDARAEQWLRQVRWEPRPDAVEEWMWGVVRVQWAVVGAADGGTP